MDVVGELEASISMMGKFTISEILDSYYNVFLIFYPDLVGLILNAFIFESQNAQPQVFFVIQVQDNNDPVSKLQKIFMNKCIFPNNDFCTCRFVFTFLEKRREKTLRFFSFI